MINHGLEFKDKGYWNNIIMRFFFVGLICLILCGFYYLVFKIWEFFFNVLLIGFNNFDIIWYLIKWRGWCTDSQYVYSDACWVDQIQHWPWAQWFRLGLIRTKSRQIDDCSLQQYLVIMSWIKFIHYIIF